MASEDNEPAVHNQVPEKVPEKTGITTLPKLAPVPKGIHKTLFT